MKKITIEVTTFHLEPHATVYIDAGGNTTKLEQALYGWIVRVIDGDAEWREEYTDHEQVKTFVRGVKACASFADVTVDVPTEWI